MLSDEVYGLVTGAEGMSGTVRYVPSLGRQTCERREDMISSDILFPCHSVSVPDPPWLCGLDIEEEQMFTKRKTRVRKYVYGDNSVSMGETYTKWERPPLHGRTRHYMEETFTIWKKPLSERRILY